LNTNIIQYIFSGNSYSKKDRVFLCFIRIAAFLVLLLFSLTLYSQENSQDTLPDTVKLHSAKRATYYSMVLPGLGQAYNRQYWKIPVIYGGLATLYIFQNLNQNEFVYWKDLYRDALDTSSATYGLYNTEVLKSAKEYYRKNRDLCTIGLFGLYVLNIIDASVYAHLFDYDVSDDLTIRIEPVIMDRNYAQIIPGIRCRIKF